LSAKNQKWLRYVSDIGKDTKSAAKCHWLVLQPTLNQLYLRGWSKAGDYQGHIRQKRYYGVRELGANVMVVVFIRYHLRCSRFSAGSPNILGVTLLLVWVEINLASVEG